MLLPLSSWLLLQWARGFSFNLLPYNHKYALGITQVSHVLDFFVAANNLSGQRP